MNRPLPTPMSAWLEQAWLQRYLDRQLTSEEVAFFEAYVMDKPELLGQIEADTALRDSVQGAHARLAEGAQTPSSASSVGRSTSRRPRAPVRWLAMAASVLFAAVLGWSLPRDNGAPFVAAPERVLYDTLRGMPDTPHVDPQPADTSGIYIADIALPAGTRIVSLTVEFEGETFELPAASLSSDGFLTLVLPKSWRGHARLKIATSGSTIEDSTRAAESGTPRTSAVDL